MFDGTYQATEAGNTTGLGVWVFSKDEIAVLQSEDLQSAYSNLGLVAVQKYYIKDNIIYTCLCTTSDCLNKDKNYSKTWKIESVNQTASKRTIKLTIVGNESYKMILEKDKSIGLDVDKWE